MIADRDIQRAVDAGKRNASGLPMVTNWCAHVRIDRLGGVGMVEQATGLPIGHHGLACDHAPAGGLASWEIRDAALDFYDRNCTSCKLRKPVGIPNLGAWVAERDAWIAKRQAEESAEARRIAAALVARQTARAELRGRLSPAAADVVDQIEELDLRRTPELTARFIETARLAPDAFTPDVVEFVFGLLEDNEQWFDEAGLRALALLSADPCRLARCAMICLRCDSAKRAAATVLLARLSSADEALIPAIMPTVIEMASPTHELFTDTPPPKVATLVRLNRAFPQQIAAALDSLLDEEPQNVNLVARAVEVLAPRATALTVRFARGLISKLVRAKWMPEPHEHHDDYVELVARNVERAVVAVFFANPNSVDQLLQDFREGVSSAGEVRIFAVYGKVLRFSRFDKKRTITAAERLAFKRLLQETTRASNDNVLREVGQVIDRHPDDFVDLARDEVDELLGVALLLEDRIRAFDARSQANSPTLLEALERRTQRQTLADLQSNLVKWAAAGASARGNPASYLQVLEGLPEKYDELAARMLSGTIQLMDTAAGLKATLPTLYAALVGTSVLRRGSAARAVAKMPSRQRENAPSLLFEAFVTTLTDQYIYVHTSAVSALKDFRLASTLDSRVRDALWNILCAHEKNSDRLETVLECIELLSSRYLGADDLAGSIGGFFVTVLAKMPTWRVSGELSYLARKLARAEGFVDLLVAHLTDSDSAEHVGREALDALASLPPKLIYTHREKLIVIPPGTEWSARSRVFGLIELLTRSRAWAEAETLASRAMLAIPDTVRETTVRLLFESVHAATAFEHALARGDYDRATGFAKRWHDVAAIMEANDHERARRPDPLRDLRQQAGGR